MIAELKTPDIAGGISYEEFLREYEGEFAEWVDGTVETMSPISIYHDDMGAFLSMLLRLYVRRCDLGRVLSAPFQMKLTGMRRGREPDILFVRKENLHRLTRTFLDGPADLAIEIVSPESAQRDRATKFAEYEAGGVGEYWVPDPDSQSVDFWMLRAGRFERVLPDMNGIYHSTVVDGFWIDTNWLWQQPAPDAAELLALYRI